MSWLFDAVGEKLEINAAPFTDEPFTLSAWIKSSDMAPAAQAFILAVGDYGSANNHFAIYQTSGAATITGRIRDTTNATCVTTGSLTDISTWHHVALRGNGSNAYTVYLDGANAGSVTSTKAPAGVDGVIVGNEWGGNRFRGRIAHVALWASDIGAADIADLAAGRNPLDTGYFTAPAAYWTLDNASTGLDDISGATFGSLTATGATFDSDNPTIESLTTIYVKLLAPSDAVGETAVEGVVLNAARDTVIGEFTGQEFVAGTGGDSGFAVLKIDVADITPNGSTLTTSDAPLVIAKNGTYGTVGHPVASVIEE